jgi:hypothetical protein
VKNSIFFPSFSQRQNIDPNYRCGGYPNGVASMAQQEKLARPDERIRRA